MKIKAKLKAHLMAPEVIQKLAIMKGELENDNAGEGDLVFWERYLSELKIYADTNTKHVAAYENYNSYYKVLKGTLRGSTMLKDKCVPVVVIAPVRGDFSLVREHIEALKQDGDTVVVMGDFMKNPYDQASIQEAIALSQEGVVFLVGQTEEAYQALHETDTDVESLFIRRLAEDLVTGDMIIHTGNTKNSVVDMEALLTGEAFPNLTQKFIIGSHRDKTDSEKHTLNEQKKVLGLPDKFATRLYFGNQ